MTTREKERRDSVLLLVLILLFGFICIILASGWALRFAPRWRLDANMNSKLNPNSEFINSQPVNFIEPLDANILTRPAWLDVFLTPGAVTQTPRPTNTPAPVLTSTPVILKTPTPSATTLPTFVPTFPVFTPVRTNTPVPPGPTITSTASNTPVPSANLAITKTDGSATYIAGNAITYTIVVSNAGPSNATGVGVADAIPASITGTTINCVANGGASCGTNASVGNNLSFIGVSIPVGANLTITVSGTVSPAATGNLVNTAMVSVGTPADPNLANNSATDTDTQIQQTNLAITKTDGSATYTPGTAITYTLFVSNAGPFGAIGASVADTIPAAITGTTINCVANGGASCGTNTSVGNNLSFTGVSIPMGTNLTITVSGTVSPAATGNLVNTATVTAGASQVDPVPGNNSASDTDTPAYSADLSITKTDNATDYAGGIPVRYVITASNAGPSSVTGATVTDTFSAELMNITWTCSGSGGASCTAAGSGDINDNAVNLPAGTSVTYIVNATVIAFPAGPSLSNTAAISPPAGVTDPNAGNESAMDTDILVVSNPPGLIGSTPDGLSQDIPAGLNFTIKFGTPLVVGSGSYLVYYPDYPNPPAASTLDMDMVILQISDGSNWYTIFNWGDGSPNANTDIPAFPPNSTDCTSEPDNCPIDVALLTINSPYPGIIINADGVVPNGTYYYIRIFSRATPPASGDGVDIDAISVVP